MKLTIAIVSIFLNLTVAAPEPVAAANSATVNAFLDDLIKRDILERSDCPSVAFCSGGTCWCSFCDGTPFCTTYDCGTC